MFPTSKKLLSSKDIVGYTLPRLHTGKDWYVDFYVYDPTIDGLKRKKYMLNKYAKNERKNIASVLIANLTQLLISGWNPFLNTDKSRSYTTWDVVIKRYTDYTKIAEKKGMLKSKTAVDYRSRLSVLLFYIEEAKISIKYVYQFDKTFVVDFLDYIVFDKERSPKTRNNYRTWLSTFATWLVDRQYIKENCVESISMMKEGEKFRDAIKIEDLRKLKEYASLFPQHYNLMFFINT